VGKNGNEAIKDPVVCSNRASSVTVTNINTSATHMRGCTKIKGTPGCDTQSGFRDYTPTEYTPGGSTITTQVPANTFPNNTYESFVMYDDNKVVPVGVFHYQNCGEGSNKPTATGNERLQSNKLCSNRDTSWTVVGINSAATRMRGCAQVAGTTGCLDPNNFRDYTPQEYTPGGTSITTRVPKNTFPDGNYGAYVMYEDGKIVHVGDASYQPCDGPTLGPG